MQCMISPEMQQRIHDEINRIEGEHDVKILFACESGSRAWGFPSPDSDYDVRMVYVHKADWYLNLQHQRDVIEEPITDVLDISGWDANKTLRLLRKVKSEYSRMGGVTYHLPRTARLSAGS